MHDEKNAPAFFLAKAGYDVWLGNFRGSKYSRKKFGVDANKNPRNFFSFTWTEMAVTDAPDMVDYVLA